MLLVAGSAQFAVDRLLASEEFAVGGTQYGRGYDTAEISGDHGIAIKTEIQYAHKINRKYFKDAQTYFFIDYGSIWQKNAAGGEVKQEGLTSTGIGIRYNITKEISGYAELAKPLDKLVTAEKNRDWRIFFSLAARF